MMFHGFFREEKAADIIICLTGLMELSDIEVGGEKGINFVTSMLDRLLTQLSEKAKIKIISFERYSEVYEEIGDAYKSNVRRVISGSEFKGRIELEFRNEYLTKQNIDSDAFILNFAGTEINDKELLNNLRFIESSLYFDNFHEQKTYLSTLEVVQNPVTGKSEIPYFIYRNSKDKLQVVDRRFIEIIERNPNYFKSQEINYQILQSSFAHYTGMFLK